MNASEFMCYHMIHSSTITSLVNSANIKHGIKWLSASAASNLPFIVAYELPGGSEYQGVCSKIITIIARAADEGAADDISRAIKKVFNGSAATGIYGTINNFDAMRCSLENPGGILYESVIPCWSAPNDFRLVYSIDTES